ncbi:MAG: replication protein [Comamonadaceae bacterium]|nr:replication protein [Comamonadaceae bacterium]
MANDFDEQEYMRKLIAGGIAPGDAADVARRTAEARRQGGTLDLSPAAVPASIEADQVKPAKKATRKTQEIATTTKDQKLIEAAAQIATTPPDGFGDFMAFAHAVLCQVGLPRSKVEGREFLRQSGAAWINIQAGILDEGKGPVLQPIPYGVMPRLALAWVSTFAMRNDTPVIPIGDSAAEFLRLMGMDDQGARYTTLRRQMHALAACRLQMGYKGRNIPNMAPVKQFDAWVANNADHQRALWPGVMTLSDEYFTELRTSAVPLDNRALLALKGSALALDVYAWLAHRLHRIQGRGVTLYWANLREQFAQEYRGKDPDKDFKQEFVPALKKVLAVYPQAKVKSVTGGVLLLGSPPPIPYKGGPTV